METRDRITTTELIIIVVNYVLAAGVFTLPRTTVERAGTPDVWISVILGGLLSMITGLIIARLSQRFPGQTIYQYSGKIIGRPLAILLGVVLIGYFVCIGSYEMRNVQEVTVFILLEGTPGWAIAGIFMWVALYLCRGGINAISRMCRLMIPITWTVFFGVSLLSLQVFDINNLRPVLGQGMSPVWRSIKPTALTFTSGEALLFLVAFMDKPKKTMKVVVSATLIAMVFYIVAVVLCIGAFSVDGVVTRTWPFIDLIRSFEVNYLVFERFESLWLTIWIMQIFCTFCIAFYGAALGLSQLTKIPLDHCLFALLPVIYIVTEIPRSLNGLFAFGAGIGNWSFFLFGVLPLPLLIIARLRGARS
ncbi:spore gernimation protein [Bacillus sp. FJAT-27264]|uniref:GerAB/ArcD/ProY family transporter n=1 Tax=Paenibacillus sp. (strain DSM 101736 / FJAT-27264) TaxID=1850362 RepID=UPI000807A371|nr:GerAB/ArcD/ProY family transporter [Bacillus sp. FJAT-27264]OBZ10469.1 spore gernimation protein [Bacillus sp. FJAT-27264]